PFRVEPDALDLGIRRERRCLRSRELGRETVQRVTEAVQLRAGRADAREQSVVAGLDVTDVALNGRGRAVEAFAVSGLRGREPRAAARVVGRTLGRQLDDVDGATAFAALEGRGEPRQRFEGGDCN